ncbi:MAG TPA: DUF1707 domain-containing protein [Solirubrobacteraceae bacterium]|nr:DUF1707 domain-containing protein [Solirubrobacteraceae bacterium]
MCGHHHRHRSRAAAATEARFAADDKRASDTERDQAISDLRAHAAEGRLSVEELDERLAAALAAKTRADLAALLDDLPRRPRDRTRERAEHVRSYLAVMALLVAIWALTGAGYFWPVWPILGWGVFVLPDALAVRRRRSRGAFS